MLDLPRISESRNRKVVPSTFSTVVLDGISLHNLEGKRCVTTQTKEVKETTTAKAADWI